MTAKMGPTHRLGLRPNSDLGEFAARIESLGTDQKVKEGTENSAGKKTWCRKAGGRGLGFCAKRA